MSIKDVIPGGISSLVEDNLPNRTPLSDLRSILVRDAVKVDPTFDITGVRTETKTRPELLAAVPEFSGFEFDPTQRSYVEDLYALYGGGVPTRDVAMGDTAQIPGAIDTLVNVGGGGGGMDQVTGGSVLDTPTNTQFEQNLLNQGIGVQGAVGDPVVAPGEMPLTQDDFDDFNKIAVTPVTPADTSIAIEDLTQPSNVGDFQITAASPLTNQTGVIPEAPVINPNLETQGPITIEGSLIPGDIPGVNPVDEVALTGGAIAPTLEAQDVDASGNLLQSGINKIKSIIPEFDPSITVGKLALNDFVGKPISLAIDAIGALASNLPPGISETTNKAREVGLLVGDTTVTQDVYGINTQSMFGDYNQYNLDRVKELQEKIDDGTIQQYKDDGTLTYLGTELEKRKDYIESTGAAGDITPDATPLDIATGNLTGDATIAETIAQNQNIVDEVALTGGDDGGGQDTGTVSTAGQAGPPSQRGGGADMGSVSTAGQAGPPSQRGGGADMGSVTTASAPPGRGGGSGGPPSQGGGSPGGGCVIATHAVNSGAFTKDTKREAVRWCVKNLHRTWWGEAIRRGYRYYGQKAIEEGKAKNHYQEFKDYIAFGTGKRRTLKTGWTFIYRSVQFFIRGLISD